MAEIPAHSSDYLHRSIDQLRSMNERGVLSSLSHLTSADLRTGLVHDYKPFININEFRQNVERLDYSIKNGLVGVGLERSVNLQQHQQQQQIVVDQHNHQQQQQQQQQQNQQAHHQTQQQSQPTKQSYSPPNSPQTPTMVEPIEQKYDPNASVELQQQQQQQQQQQHIIHKPNRNQQASPEGREGKPYKCSTCPKTFANSSYLSQHTRIHLGIKPYRCEICQRKFTQLSHLQQHIRTHTGDKPYKCRHEGCPKAFSQLSNLQSHSRCHQTDKPFKCNSCYKCFTDELALHEHIPKHKDSKHLKTHICQLCGKSYTQQTYLQKHLQKHAEKVEKQQRQSNASGQHHVPAGGIGLNLQRQVVMNAAAAAGDAYWAKMGADSAVNAATLAEAIQQQQQQQQQQGHNGYNFATLQQQQQQQELLQHHHRLVNGGSVSGGDSAGSGSTPNHSQSPNEEGEDLVMRHTPHQQQQHLQQQPQQQSHSPNTIVVVGNSPNPNYDIKTTSAFTPINTAPPHLNALAAQQRPPAYLYQQNAAAAFPTQLISLHQIRNYAHQPGAAGLLASDHLLGLTVTAGGSSKDKGQ